jgi:hypothetical protein
LIEDKFTIISKSYKLSNEVNWGPIVAGSVMGFMFLMTFVLACICYCYRDGSCYDC